MLSIPDYRLRLPGPTAVPERVRQATALPVLNHRGAEFKAMLAECQQRLKPIFGTAHDVLIFAGSGTAMMEAALVNILSPGDAILIVVAGQFGDRFVVDRKGFRRAGRHGRRRMGRRARCAARGRASEAARLPRRGDGP